VIARFIEQIDAWLLRQQCRHGGAPLLPARKRRDRAQRVFGKTQTFKCRVRDGQVALAFTLPELQVRMAPDHDRLQRAHTQGLFAILRQQSQLLRDMTAREVAYISLVDVNAAVTRRGQARKRVQRQALAAAVAPKNGKELTAADRERQVLHQHARAGRNRELLGAQRRHGCRRVTLQTPAVKPAVAGSSLRDQRARSCSRPAPSTHSSSDSAHSW
jgi:hypothetical protein